MDRLSVAFFYAPIDSSFRLEKRRTHPQVRSNRVGAEYSLSLGSHSGFEGRQGLPDFF